MKKITLLAFLMLSFVLNAQSIWKKTNAEKKSTKELLIRKNTHKKYEVFSLNTKLFKKQLNQQGKNAKNSILLPSTLGTTARFSVQEDSNFESGLAAKFPNIKSYTARGIDDPSATAKISIGTDGVHVMIFSAKHKTLYIDPYTKDQDLYIVYKRGELDKTTDFECEVEKYVKKEQTTTQQRNADDSLLRTYRIAIACTGEYAQFHLNQQGVSSSESDATKKAAILSAMNTTMTRVNGIYTRDLSVKMVIVNNNENLIFLNASTDNLNNNNADTLINQSQTVCDNIIGSANYDVGHTFSTGAGGLAGLGVVCVNGQKGRGVTGSSQPINDAYDIDYVAHELGHQFGANHTFNGSAGSCGGINRNNATAVEPGSGSTIMAYAGICSPQNVQNNSDDHFHSVSIDEMWAHIQGTGSCAQTTNTGNSAPTANAGNDYTIPKSTPFVLKGQGTDADENANLTYNWEQIDNEIATMPPVSTSTGGPLFRSISSKTSPNRYMPSLTNVVAGTTNTWEVLPSVARNMNFSLVVRDNHPNGGQSARDDMEVTVSNTAGPFVVTSQNTTTTWDTGSTQTITWDVASTNQAPVNCANVRIKLSTDGGVTFPITLIENTPNDGSYNLVVPNNPTSNARIMIEAVDNIFYNVNSTNFTINSTVPTFVLTNTTAPQYSCNTGNNSVSYILNLDFKNGFSETVSFNATNTPNGANVTFSPSSINADGNVTMTVSNFDGANTQEYTMTVTGTSNTITQTTDAVLKVINDSFSNITLTAPANGETDTSILPTLSWGEEPNATSYDIKIATDGTFNNVVHTATTNSNTYQLTQPLQGNTTYYWSVKPKNDCGEGNFNNIASFTTETPSYCDSNFTKTDSEYITNVTFNTINNNSGSDHANGGGDGYEDFTNISTTVATGSTHQISVTFNPVGYQSHCYVFIDWNRDYVFNKTTERYDLGTGSGTNSTKTLNITVPTDANIGNTRMRIVLEYTGNNAPHGTGACNSDHTGEWGETEDYTVTVDAAASIKNVSFDGFSLFPNPSNGDFNISFNVINTDKVAIKLIDIRGRVITKKEFSNVNKTFSTQLNYNEVSSGIYLLQIQNGNKQTTKKIIIK